MDSVFDLFSGHSQEYARFRPDYPESLFEHISGLCQQQQRALDIATGSGQAARALADHFQQVLAVDVSLAQLRHANSHPRVRYLAGRGEQIPVADASLDLITVAQALHWLNLPRFNQQVHRTLKPGGVLAVWCYGNCHVTPAVDEVVAHLYQSILGRYWSAQRRWVENGYRHLKLPLLPQATRHLQIEKSWTLAQFCGYLQTWSALQRYLKTHTESDLKPVWQALAVAWGDARSTKVVRWPLTLRVTTNPG
ncbi:MULTISPECIES: class I SAM-dependent methyltransferase [Ferrimonas]|uniref:class I SAM-dependent methyltransferase n=1 Tax=Ferrimonas TaxID=44011 RepID=UPI00040063B6|nr:MULTISPECIES: class I SAM-dependent methyltransferase [Ferrimonas]USD38309.1 class I SAM-dependent methyltransferase [Ferrimonas sp. SCSIO 43195]